MFFDNVSEIKEIAKKVNFSIFVVPPETDLKIKNALYLHPDPKKNKITVDMVRDFISMSNSRQKSDTFFVVAPADLMNEAAENAFLKNLEEPKDFYHYILLTEHPSALLPTVLSRAQIFYLKKENPLEAELACDEKVREFAKKLIVAKPNELLKIATEIAKKKDNARSFALEIVSTSIEILYKSYFKTNNKKLLQKIPNLIKLYDNLNHNGNIKLHIVADML